MPGPQRARPAGPEHAYPSSYTELLSLAVSFLKIAHWLILLRENEGHGGALDENGCFTERKCVLRWTAMDLEAISYLKSNHLSIFIDFQIGNERKREFRAAEMRLYLHKEFCAAEIRFYL